MVVGDLTDAAERFAVDGVSADTPVVVQCPNHGTENARPAVVSIRTMETAEGPVQVVAVQCIDCAEDDE